MRALRSFVVAVVAVVVLTAPAVVLADGRMALVVGNSNPLARSMQRTMASRSVSGGSFGSLNESLFGDETLVVYAAAGTLAAAGRGRNNPYTAALLAHLEQPLEIGLLFHRVRAPVLASTTGRQRPRNLGFMHATGPGVRQDPEQAGRLYRRAADQRDDAAQHALGRRYEQGRDVRRTRVEAKRYGLAADPGYDEACDRLDDLR